ncbi:MAG TPA: hypothetical protein VFM14_12225 [Gemmatimonadales bacterium]|nr:hypothetical protein [Gemmatimonadales bacterium]
MGAQIGPSLDTHLYDVPSADPDNVEAAAVLGTKYGLRSDPGVTARVAAEHGLIERLE